MPSIADGAVERHRHDDGVPDQNDARTKSASIHYTAKRQKDLAGASLEFDVRQKRINHAT
ncbi:hypothetical protein [Bradyrhizobium sp.]|jgi:hypothetical protein|uniref:hypothetical protein n=1 Tax=Bradyrhizobium sp. TaxID=376 RepID=UPI002DDD6F12|nr:hypothetical protein [Bradyrhizobium sp.]HEV2153761.1 hypothetical protein [Bradyrhizobium sp.]